MFIVVLIDHHTDPEFHLFSYKDSGIAKAEELSENYDWHNEDVEQLTAEELKYSTGVFNRQLSVEGDYIYIEEIELED